MLGVFFPWRMEQIFNFKETLISHLHLRSRQQSSHSQQSAGNGARKKNWMCNKTHASNNNQNYKWTTQTCHKWNGNVRRCIYHGLWDIRLCLVTTRPLYLCTDLVVQQWQRFTHTRTLRTRHHRHHPSQTNLSTSCHHALAEWLVDWHTLISLLQPNNT